MKHLLFVGIFFAAFHISQTETPAFCLLPVEMGQGSENVYSLFYDLEQDRCRPFIFSGQGGNANRFINERECLRNCSANFEKTYPTDAAQACHFKKAAGTCNGRLLRFYYDSVNRKCKSFLWTGCTGNGNRFFTAEQCNGTCVGIHDDGEEPEEEESDTPIAIIVGVLLALIIVALIITVIVLTVKSKKNKKKKNRDLKSATPLQERPIEME